MVHSIEKTGLERAETAHGQLKTGEANIKIYYKLLTKAKSSVGKLVDPKAIYC